MFNDYSANHLFLFATHQSSGVLCNILQFILFHFKLLGYKDELAVCPALLSPASK